MLDLRPVAIGGFDTEHVVRVSPVRYALEPKDARGSRGRIHVGLAIAARDRTVVGVEEFSHHDRPTASRNLDLELRCSESGHSLALRRDDLRVKNYQVDVSAKGWRSCLRRSDRVPGRVGGTLSASVRHHRL